MRLQSPLMETMRDGRWLQVLGAAAHATPPPPLLAVLASPPGGVDLSRSASGGGTALDGLGGPFLWF